jgi:uncharacterized membrane protein
MPTALIELLLSLALIGAGLMAGVYFAFSTFIMAAFDRLGPVPAARAMNAINEVILRSWFMPLFFGSTLIYAALAIVALFDSGLAGRAWLCATSLVYVIGMFLCTALFNVPLNNRLATAGDDSVTEAWQHYIVYWTRWNHLRSLSSLCAFVGSLYWLVTYGQA